ncbi:protein FLOURY 1-like [Neltuma alba]|uniref:protein FLOURY 1-like n=1 Tax=Neltuma alba TaxID=207710 RepID=UPI0010A3F574|nr:protein FLOURY 1-like [Prosopis alba]
MQTLGRFCLLFVTYSVLELYHRFLRIFLGLFVMDFSSTLKFFAQVSEIGCGFLLLGSFSRVFNVFGMILIFGFCMKILHLGWHSGGLIRYLFEFGGKTRNRFPLENSVGEEFDSKILSLKCSPLKSSQNPNSSNKSNFCVGEDKDNLNGDVSPTGFGEEKGDHDKEVLDEDDVFDVMILRKLVKIERQRAITAYAELEKERTASSSAADEAMAMILRLQSEKSSVEIQSNQYRRVVEQKQEYDQNVIESLRLIIKEQESERVLSQDRLRIYREKLSQLISEDEIDQLDRIHDCGDFLDLSAEDGDDDPNGSDSLISSLEMDSQEDIVSSERC